MEKLLKIYLRSPKKLVDEANVKVEETIRKFDFACLILKEIILRSRGTEGAQQKKIEDLSSEAQQLKLQGTFLEDQVKRNTDNLANTKAKAEKAEKDLDESIQNVDSWWSIIKTGMRMSPSLTNFSRSTTSKCSSQSSLLLSSKTTSIKSF